MKRKIVDTPRIDIYSNIDHGHVLVIVQSEAINYTLLLSAVSKRRRIVSGCVRVWSVLQVNSAATRCIYSLTFFGK